MDWKILPAAELSAWVLTRLFADEGAGGEFPERPRAFPLATYQEAGLRRAERILDRRGGVVIADSVGLGKTFIALGLIEDELRRGGGAVVVVPAALRSAWRARLRRWSAETRAGRLHLISHAQLSRGAYPGSLAGRGGVVVVDEAHRFRNPATRRHGALRELCSGATVVLLTATPVNNGVGDLHALLGLFAADHAFADVGVASLRALFAPRDVAGPRGRPAWTEPGLRTAAVRRVLREVMVRRTRSMLRRCEADLSVVTGPVRFPRRARPVVVRYEEPRMAERARAIGALELLHITIGTGRPGGQSAGGQASLVRLGLLKRLDSSRSAFERSVRRQLEFGQAFLSALDGGRLLRPRDHARGRSDGDLDPLQLVLFDLIAEPCDPGLDRVALRDGVERDLSRCRRILAAADGPDPKLDALAERIAAIACEKVVVFTEFRDTAEAIWRRLAPMGGVARIDGGGAWLGLQPAGRAAVIERFAPRANGAPEPSPRERVDVLIATDVLAEGLNLQDARHVVCYDMPWNPIRVVQRVGRIDRPGSAHDTVVPHLFLPADGLEDVLGLARRLRQKLDGIASTMGGDDVGELLVQLGGDASAAIAAFDALEARQEDPLERLRHAWQTRSGGRTDHGPRPPAVEAGTVLVAGLAGYDAVAGQAVVLARAMGRLRLAEVSPGGVVDEPGPATAQLLETALSAASHPELVEPGRVAAEAARVGGLVRSYFDVLWAAGRAPRPSHPGRPAARLARRLRAAMAGTGGWLDPDTVARGDRAIQTLDQALPPEVLRRARALATEVQGVDDPAFILDRIEELLGATGPPDAGPPPGPDTVILAVLLATPSAPGPTPGPG